MSMLMVDYFRSSPLLLGINRKQNGQKSRSFTQAGLHNSFGILSHFVKQLKQRGLPEAAAAEV